MANRNERERERTGTKGDKIKSEKDERNGKNNKSQANNEYFFLLILSLSFLSDFYL